MKHLVFFTYFGDGRYFPLLQQAIRGYARAGMPLDRLCVLTDHISSVPTNEVEKIVRVNPSLYTPQYVRSMSEGRAFDYKSCLIMSLLDTIQEQPVCILDCDNSIHGDFSDELLQVGPEGFAIAPDPGRREIVHPMFTRAYIEQSSSCMVFPADSRHLMRLYRELFTMSTERDHLLLEQRTWSLVAVASLGHVMLSATMSWSRMWDERQAPGPIKIRHHHGEEKWL